MTKIINRQARPFKKTSSARSFNLKYFNTVLFTLIAGLGVFYLVLINDLTVQGFKLQQLNSQANNLANITMNNQERVNVSQSFPFLNSHLKNLGLVAANNIQYLSTPGSVLAKR